jgi:hypothetical protein
MTAPAVTASVDLRPLSTSELVDRTFQLYRKYFFSFLLFGALVNAVPFLFEVFLTFFGFRPTFKEIFSKPDVLLWLGLAGSVLLFIIKLGEGALTYYVAEAYLGRLLPIRGALQLMWPRAWRILWTFIVKMALIFAALSLILLPPFYLYVFRPHASWTSLLLYVLATVVLLIPGIVVTMRYLCSMQAVMLEGLSGFKAVRRSSEIVRYDPGKGFMYWGETRISIVLLVVFAVNAMLYIVTALPSLLIWIPELMQGRVSAADTGVSSTLIIGTNFLHFLGNSVVTPLYAIALTVFYYDVRVRKEGYDVELLARQMRQGV